VWIIDWCDREVVHTGYRYVLHALSYGVVLNAKYGCTFSNLCARIHLDDLQQQKTSDFLRLFVLFEGQLFVGNFSGPKEYF
jgi:hypothetical protein